MTAARIAAGLRDGMSLAQVARRLDMSPAVARDMAPPEWKRARIMSAIENGASMFAAARSISIRNVDALRLLGVDDPKAPTPPDLEAVILARFDAGQAPSRISYALELTSARVTAVLRSHRPLEFGARLIHGGGGEKAAAAAGLPQAVVKKAKAAIVAASRDSQPAAKLAHPRIILRTGDGLTTMSTDPEDLPAARRQMQIMARGREWTEGPL